MHARRLLVHGGRLAALAVVVCAPFACDARPAPPPVSVVTLAPSDANEPAMRELPPSRDDLSGKADGRALACLTDADAAVERARRESRPLLVHACASWAVACVEQKRVLSDPRVARAAAPFVCLVVDLTEDSPETDALASRFGVVGVPGWSLIDTSGRATHDTGAKTADQLVEILGAFVER